MKAKEMAAVYLSSGFHTDKLTDILIDLSREPGQLLKARKISDNNARAITAVFDEVEGRWKAFVRRVNSMPNYNGYPLPEDGFRTIMKEMQPELYGLVDKLRAHVAAGGR